MTLWAKLVEWICKPVGGFAPDVRGEDLLDPSGRYFKCSYCNTQIQLDGFNPKQMAEELAKRHLTHLPNCPLGND